MNKKIILLLILFILIVLNSSCSTRKLVIGGTKPLLENIELAFLYENDPQLAKEALPMTIKLAEGFYHYYPKSPYYSGKLCFLYAAYTFGFLDDTPYNDFAENSEEKLANINEKYNRAIKYGFLSLSRQIKEFNRDKLLDKTNREKILQQINNKHIETVFWLMFAWANIIFNNLDDPNVVVELDIIKDLANRLLALDSDYLYGASYAILLAYYGGRSDNLGGNYQLSQQIYQTASKRTKGKSLILDFVLLKYVCPKQYDQETFKKIYHKIINHTVPKGNEMSLINVLVQKKAEKIYSKKEDIF